MCDHVKGSCNGQCVAGWQGDVCTDKCTGKYGQDCKHSCGDRHCEDNAQCDHVTGSCNGQCVAGWQGDACSVTASESKNPDSGNDVLLIASIAVAVVVVIAVVVIVVVFIRRRRRIQKENSHETLVLRRPSRNTDKAHEVGETNVYVNVGMTSTLQEQPIVHQPKHVPVVAVQQRVKAHNETAKGDNKGKVKGSNTYCNVKISGQDDEDITDAVAIIEADNKSDGQTGNDVDEHDAYYNKTTSLPEGGFDMMELETIIQRIRNQRGGFEAEFLAYNRAPREGTVVDFWRVIWEQDCGQIIMLTNLMEAGRVGTSHGFRQGHKCEPYWDDDKPMAVSFFNVVVKETFHLAEYSIRKIQVTQTKSGKLTQKTFDHYHFTSWPDHGVPNVLDLLDFLWKTRDTPRPRPGPVLVHCSAGIGRTGTYIALHILIDEMNATGQLNILQTITKMRHQRKNMIQTKEQYECVFITLLEVVKYGQTSMPTNHYLQAYPTKGGNLTMGRKTIDQLAEDIVSMNSPYNADAQVKNRLWVNGQQDQFVVGAPVCKDVYITINFRP
ncbi:receptor-type tyrosine-protein phosphatase delta-like [Gigantopelta aegis]|uniref:receptor-type tyrosine-protein phosphatase delta-like n=1 Tax=Gigantopelta aegis TaxID=1735272 RepID=UPI001B88A790|nr:receptor-type tyrosine-protein phosphatase delta-like [Gigantopelta aegis]